MRACVKAICLIICVSCSSKVAQSEIQNDKKSQPNILWVVCEDISPILTFYGDKTAKTPNLDALAKESVVYDNAFAVVGVCGPSRSSIITGMYPTSIGTMHMRTGLDIQSWGKRNYKTNTNRFDLEGEEIIQYSAVIPDYVKCFTEYLRQKDYFTTNNQKTDYQFAAPVTAWDENNKKAHWRNRKDNQPFFSVFNFDVTHESKIWKNADKPLTVNPSSVKVPPYYQDTKVSRTDLARVYSNIELLDKEVGHLLQQLKDDGLYDNTIIFFYSDHGGPLPRQKRELYNSGLHVPFMIKGLDGKSGRSQQMVSFVDLAPTVLNLAGITIPKHIQGKVFLGNSEIERREYAFGTSDRFDEFTDRSRTVYFDDYIYIQNDFPDKMWYKDIGYRKQVPVMSEMLKLYENKSLNTAQMKWFKNKPHEELYHRKKDPQNLKNLAFSKRYESQLEKGRKLLNVFRTQQFEDRALQPEVEMLKTMWPNLIQPKTAEIEFIFEPETGLKVAMACKTKGASIAYLISDELINNLDYDSGWQLYTWPINIKRGQYIYAMAERIGFKTSEISLTIAK